MTLTLGDLIQIGIIIIGFVVTITTLKNDVKHLDRRLSDHILSDGERFSEQHEDMRELRDRLSGGR